MPKIGARVVYATAVAGQARTCIGTVTKQYFGYRGTNEDGQYEVPSTACVKVDAKPEWWPYADDVFAPEIKDLKLEG